MSLDRPEVTLAVPEIDETHPGDLTCTAASKPPSTITWYKNVSNRWEALPSSIRKHNLLTYRIENASRDDAAIFRCTANNGYGGGIEEEVELVVRCRYSEMNT